MSIKHVILGLLADTPMHGYDLKLVYENALAPLGKLNVGQVYTTLDRLEQAGLVRPEKVIQGPRPDKIVYQLTPEGSAELNNWLSQPTKIDLDLRNETFLKLMIAQRSPSVDALAVLKQERSACFASLHNLTVALGELEQRGAPLSQILLLDLTIHRLNSFIQWLDRCEERLTEETES